MRMPQHSWAVSVAALLWVSTNKGSHRLGRSLSKGWTSISSLWEPNLFSCRQKRSISPDFGDLVEIWTRMHLCREPGKETRPAEVNMPLA